MPCHFDYDISDKILIHMERTIFFQSFGDLPSDIIRHYIKEYQGEAKQKFLPHRSNRFRKWRLDNSWIPENGAWWI